MDETSDIYFGTYVGELILKPLSDGRRMKLFQDFGFNDLRETNWNVPRHAIVDGASIPQSLWSIIGGPFEGKYRDASVIHDYFCDVRTRPWRDVHRVFYEGMRASGVGETRAKIMYAAVYFKGPRWNDTVVHNSNIKADDNLVSFRIRHSDFQLKVLDAIGLDNLTAHEFLKNGNAAYPQGERTFLDLEILSDAIATENPSLTEIEAAIDSSVEVLEPWWNEHERSFEGLDRMKE